MSPPAPADGTGSFFDELRRGLERRAGRTKDRVDERIWGPLRELAAQLGERASEARRCEDPLRDAGRALRMACDEIESLSLAAVLEEELRAHLEEVLPLAHALPRSMELEGEGRGRRVPARATATAVLRGDYPTGLAERLRPEALVVAPTSSLPPSPADLLGEDDWQAVLAGAVESAAGHLDHVLDELAGQATEQVRRRLLAGGPFTHLRARFRDRKSRREGEDALAALRRSLAAADEEGAAELRHRRLAADLARRERPLREVASEAASLARGLADETVRIRRIADGLEALATGERALPREGEPDEASAGLRRLVERVRSALEERREALSPASAAGERLDAALTRLTQRAGALGTVAEDFLSREGSAPEEAPAKADEGGGELAALARAACQELAAELHSRLEDAREGLREAGEIVRHGAEAARAGAPDGEEPAAEDGHWDAEAAREACRRAAHRLRETASMLEVELETAAGHLESVPDRILAAIRDRLVPGPTGGRPTGTGSLGPGEVRPPVSRGRRLARRLRAYLEAIWRGVLRLWESLAARVRRWSSSVAAVPEREGQQARTAGGGAAVAELVSALEEGADLAGLPANYRWLFRDEPLDDPRLMVGREGVLDRLRAARDRWANDLPAAVALVGGPGSGKTTLLNAYLSEIEANGAVRRGAVDRRLATRPELVSWLRSFLFPARGGGPGAGAETGDLEVVADALRDRRELVLLENGERLFRREVGGYGALGALTEFIEATAGRLGWIVTFEKLPWRFVQTVSSLGGAFDEVLELGPLGREELAEAVMARHRLTGYDLEFVPPEGAAEAARGGRLEEGEERQASLRARCFDALQGSGDREVGEALFLWRRWLRSDPGRPGIVVARPAAYPDTSSLERLDRAILFALVALVVHGDLDRDAIAAAAGASTGPGALHLLETSGLLEEAAGQPPAPLRIRPFMSRIVTRALRDANVLPLAGGEG